MNTLSVWKTVILNKYDNEGGYLGMNNL